ncbi:CAP-Gly domain-containing linker protein 1 [Schistosoma japonicum]|nr:CAP-Gly domain-containing linker protein 1 [Schistosoma japonicum]
MWSFLSVCIFSSFDYRCQQEILYKLGERQKNDVLESQQTNQLQNKRIHDIKSKLFQEYERLYSLAEAFHTLNITTVNNNNQNCNNQTNMNNCYTKKNRIVIATVHPLDDDKVNESNNNNTVHNEQIICKKNNNSDLKSQLDNASNSLEIMKLRKQQLNIYEAYQCHYQKILKKLSAYQQMLNEQMYEIYEYEPGENSQPITILTESTDPSNSHYNPNELYLFDAECNTNRSIDSHKSIYREHQLLLKETKEKNNKLSMEISVMNAEITHLASRPERQLFDYLKQLESCKSFNDSLHQTIQNLEEQIVKIHKHLEEAKDKLNKEDNIHLTLLRMNLRIHQLKQMEIKAHSLHHDQCVSIQTKEKELTEATNKMDLLSQVWANERQVKIEAIQKLRENLKFLSDNQPKACVNNKPNRKQHTGSINNNGTQILDLQEPSLPYSLFSALCKEIRRLQSRSVSLVEALDLLNTGSCNTEKLDQIKSLVLSSNQTKVSTCAMNWKSSSPNNVFTNIKRNMHANSDIKQFNSVRSVKLRNNGNISLNARSSNRYSNVHTSTYSKHITISDNRKHKVSPYKNSADGNLKNVLVQESTDGNITYPNALINPHIEKSLPSPAQQQHEQQNDLVHDTSEEQAQQRLYHYNLSIPYSPRVQRRPVSFYLSRSLDKFVKMPIPEADEEEQTDEDVEGEDGDRDDESEDENKKENGQNKSTGHYDNHGGCYNHEGIRVELSKESTMILISNQS